MDAQQVRSPEKSWPHLVAGGAGGIATAIATAPLDVLRTRFQSSVYSHLRQSSAAVAISQTSFVKAWLERVKIISQSVIMLQKVQGWRGFYRGLGPSMIGAPPATAVYLYTYGNCKHIYADYFGLKENASSVHMAAAVTAGIATCTATNPIWVVKTRMQLDNSPTTSRPRHHTTPQYVVHILKQEGIRGFYRGLSASYLGVAESALHLVLYERLKEISQSKTAVPQEFPGCQRPSQRKHWEIILSYVGIGGSAAIAKLIAGVVAYPHEVIRTRLRQAPLPNGELKYTSLNQCIRIIWREEGLHAFYGGIIPHMLRAVPSAAITLGVYEAVLYYLQ